MQEHDPIRGIRIIFALCGYNLNFTKNVHLKILITIILIFNLILINCKIISELNTFRNITKIQNSVAKMLLGSFWFYHHILLLKSAKIVVLVTALDSHLKREDTKRSYYLSYGIVVWTAARFVSNFTVIDDVTRESKSFSGFFGIPSNSILEKVFYVLSFIIQAKFETTETSDFTYLLIFYLLFRSKLNLINRINANLKNPLKLPEIVFQCTDEIRDIHAMFESTMSVFPFITISRLFFEVSQNVYFMSILSGAGSAYLISDIIAKISSATLLIVVTNHLNSKFIEEAGETCKNINQNSRIGPHIRSALTCAVRNSSELKVTGWGMFTIDLSLILAFLSSHVTFTILFLAD